MVPRPSPTDSYPTETSRLQASCEGTLAQHIPRTADSAPSLQKNAHLQYLVRNLLQGFPARYISQDASQPWLLFWSIHGFSLLQVALDPNNKQRVIDTVMTWQHPDGGFGGGPGQSAHLLPTFAAVCALAIAGRPGPRGGWDQIDREKLYQFFLSLKQPDGSFLVAHHAEVDIRGIYCLLVTAHLLNILTPSLIAGTASFIASCQTYEGGFASASHPYYSPSATLLEEPRPPLGEAHGGYTFCALASLVMLNPLPNPDAKKVDVDVRKLMRWLAMMQGSEIELGGFRGRTNKLVDGCYSWWIGGSFALVQALGVERQRGGEGEQERAAPPDEVPLQDAWDDVDDSTFNRAALQEYILYAAQHPAGGLRDKPHKHPDAYHTLYCLSGLSAAQHRVVPSPARRAEIRHAWKDSGDETLDALRKAAFAESLSWIEEEGTSHVVGGPQNRVNATHPLFNLTITHTEGIMSHFYDQTLPKRAFKMPSK